MSLFVLLMAGAAFLVVLALPLWRMSPRRGGAQWALAWCALFGSGLTLRLSESAPALGFLYPALGTVFAGLLFAGARRYGGRPVPRWFWPLVIAASTARGALIFLAPAEVTRIGATLAILLGGCFAAREVFRTSGGWRAGPAELLLIAALPLLAVVSSVYEWTKYTGADLQFGFFLWLVSGCFVAGTQIAAIFEQYRGELEARLFERSEQLRASLLRLEEQQRLVAVGTLAAGIAHQINNPIGAIAAAAEFALLDHRDSDPVALRQQALERVLDEARRCGRIVKSVLQFARHEPTTKWIEGLNPTVLRASQLVRDYVAGRGGRLTIKLSDDPLRVRMSPIALEQVVVNLIRNAAESRAEGARVEVETVRVDDRACIYVGDDGPGVDPALRARLFEPFFTTRLAEGGSGLGLSVVHGVVADHGGELEVDARPGGGARFCVRLPIVDEEPGSPPGDPARA